MPCKMQNKPHANYCGAKTRSGKPCKNRAMQNGRCRMHGGKSTGAPSEKMKKNKNSTTHGLFSRYLPEETMRIMDNIDSIPPQDILWTNIKMQFASIIRAQQIMYVDNKDDMTKEIKKHKESMESEEIEYEIQFAWDKQATFMNSLSRSMAELRNMLKQFVEMADYDDYRLLEIKKMQKDIEKTDAEIAKVKGEDEEEYEDDGFIDAIKSSADIWDDENE